MSFWILLQILVDIVLIASLVGLWIKLNRPAKDDPRLSRGLQLLQSKISVIEDLGDRTEVQVQQLTQLLEQKAREVQAQVQQADRQIKNIDTSMNRSLEVAKIFQDKIPHQEIIERQNTVKYVKAARMAHQGASVEEISRAVDLSLGEIEFISKVNRDQLQFSEADLPDWVEDSNLQGNTLQSAQFSQVMPQFEATSSVSARPPVHSKDVEGQALADLGNQFRKALITPEVVPTPSVRRPPPEGPVVQARSAAPQGRVSHTGEVRRVIFPKVDISGNLG